jgi:anti-sigma28 factor (negative regulator of flagellin synthesis)
MKINPPNVPSVPVSTLRSRDAAPKAGERSDTRPERVEVSDAARFVERIREAVRKEEPIRTDEVERVRAAVQAGTYESSVDLDEMVNRLLGDL